FNPFCVFLSIIYSLGMKASVTHPIYFSHQSYLSLQQSNKEEDNELYGIEARKEEALILQQSILFLLPSSSSSHLRWVDSTKRSRVAMGEAGFPEQPIAFRVRHRRLGAGHARGRPIRSLLVAADDDIRHHLVLGRILRQPPTPRHAPLVGFSPGSTTFVVATAAAARGLRVVAVVRSRDPDRHGVVDLRVTAHLKRLIIRRTPIHALYRQTISGGRCLS
ncbi:unnamed protein product, partial [Musa acuminata var. zebrina]